MTDLGFALLLLAAGAAFIVYSGPLGDRARSRGARFGRELYVVAGAFLVSFGLLEISRELLF